MWYYCFNGREVHCQTNREGTKERKNYPSMDKRGEIMCINEVGGNKIKSCTMVEFKEEV